MCGIVGRIGPSDSLDVPAMSRALDRLAHRGPDGSGTALVRSSDHAVWLGHRRLAIIDLSQAADQPMTDPANGNVIIFNGEIYNFRALRAELEAEGRTFSTASDTEVILAAYARWGSAAFARLAGMFAIALWDESRSTLVLARDHVGIKPLYFFREPDGAFTFGSEVRALLATGRIERKLDPAGLESYLAFGSVQSPLTLIDGVQSLPAGHTLSITPGGAAEVPVRFWEPPFNDTTASTPATTDVERLLRNVVREHLESDVPLGAFLSGGIDSSAIVALMSEAAPETTCTFSVTFKEDTHSEARYSRLVAARYSKRHTEIELTRSDLLRALPDVLASTDLPSVDGANVFLLSRVVRKAGVTVVLSGQGADEVFGGYPTFRRVARISRARRLLRLIPRKARQAMARRIRGRAGSGVLEDKLEDVLTSDLDATSVYLRLRGVFGERDRRGLLADPSPPDMRDGLPGAVHADLRRRVQGLDPVNAVSLLEISTYLQNTLLRDGDAMSMASGIEVRVPFLDHRVVSAIARMPGRKKLRRGRPKPVLLDAMGGRIPREVWDRTKGGFTFPWPEWLRGDMREEVGAILDRPDAGAQLGFRQGAVQRIWRAFLDHDPTVGWSRVWALYVLLHWCASHGIRGEHA